MTIDTDDLAIGLKGFDERLRFPLHGIALLKGTPGAGKSTFAYCAVASLQKWSIEPIKAIIIDTEGGFSKARFHDILEGYQVPVEPDYDVLRVKSWDEIKTRVKFVKDYESPKVLILDSLGFQFRQEFMESDGRTVRDAGNVVRDLSRILIDLRACVEESNGYAIVTNWLRSQIKIDGTPRKQWDFLGGTTLAYAAKCIYDIDLHPCGLGTLTVDKHKNAPMGMQVHYRFTDHGIEYVEDATYNSTVRNWSNEHKDK